MESDLIGFLVSLGVWNWLILGVALLAIEIVAPGIFMLWLGLAALMVGVISFFVAWPWQAQIVAFAVFSLALIPAWRRFTRKTQDASDRPFLNRRTEAMVGQVFTLDQPIVNGSGAVRVGDTLWRVLGPDCEAGHRVKVVSADGVDLHVKPVQH